MDALHPGALLSRGIPYGGHMTIRPCTLGLHAARSQMRQVAADLRFSGDEAADLLIAVGEALSNAYLHGTPDRSGNLIYLGWRLSGDDGVLTITIEDEGDGFRPRDAATLTAAAGLGLGVRLMCASVDEVYFEFDNGARVVLKKHVGDRIGSVI